MELPDAAIEWILANSVISNVEFFQLSNVSRRVRRVMHQAVLDRVIESSSNINHENGSSCLDSLLLPCMLLEMIRMHADKKEHTLTTHGTFCAAWFHPSGIFEQIVSLREDETAECGSTQSFAPGGELNISDSSPDEGDSRSRRSRGSYKQRNRKARSKSPASRSLSEPSQLGVNEVRCCKEWRGYREPMQVLQHFGASEKFVNDLIDAVLAYCSSAAAAASNELRHESSEIAALSVLHPLIAKPTFAIRGATVARPDNYCFCRDAQEDKELKSALASQTATKLARESRGWKDIRQREYNQSVARIQRRRRDDQRAVLPRVLLPSDVHTPVLVKTASETPTIPHTIQAVITLDSIAKVEADTNDDTYRATNKKSTKPNYSSLSELFTTPITEGSVSHEPLLRALPLPEGVPKTVIGRKCRSVQFLNADGSHAVCMTTPPFACGPLTLPVTIFCVGIATEDGCFLSGLHHRFELGHMYPNTPAAEISELSAVCVATDAWGDGTMAEQNGTLIHNNVGKLEESYDSSPDSDDSSCDVSDDDGTTTPNCECDYQRVERKLDMADRHDDDEPEKAVCYGTLGPGTWHCYVVVLNGDKAQIRIDGLAENVRTTGPTEALCEARLDGVTIGSDHKWDLSLCCGFGSGGEGEGAIAELAVFHGALDIADIDLLESEMMQRHGIPAVERLSSEDRSIDYDLMRRAQALFVQNPTAEVLSGHVPLRYMSRHRSVAWKQYNAVTGAAMIQQKIGARSGGESSEW